jgi:hypothetical protein
MPQLTFDQAVEDAARFAVSAQDISSVSPQSAAVCAACAQAMATLALAIATREPKQNGAWTPSAPKGSGF